MNKLACLLVCTGLGLVMFYRIRQILNRADSMGVHHPR